MAGYWPSTFLACLQDEVKVHKQAKTRMRPISIHLDQTGLVNKEFIIWKNNTIFFWDTVGQDSAILPTQVTNDTAGFSSSCPLIELAI